MLLSLQGHPLTQYWDKFSLNQLPLLLMGKRSTLYRNSWTPTGWGNTSNIRSHMRDMERNMMNGCSEMICWRTLGQNPLRIMKHNSMPNTLWQSIILMRLGLEPRDKDLSRKGKKTCSES